MGCVFQCLFSLSFSVGRTCLCVCRYACICVCIHMQAKGPFLPVVALVLSIGREVMGLSSE